MSDWTDRLPPLNDVTPDALSGSWEVWMEEDQGTWTASWLLRGQVEAQSVRTSFAAVGQGRISQAQARARALGEMRRRDGPELPQEPSGLASGSQAGTDAGGRAGLPPSESEESADMVGDWKNPPPRNPNPRLRLSLGPNSGGTGASPAGKGEEPPSQGEAVEPPADNEEELPPPSEEGGPEVVKSAAGVGTDPGNLGSDESEGLECMGTTADVIKNSGGKPPPPPPGLGRKEREVRSRSTWSQSLAGEGHVKV